MYGNYHFRTEGWNATGFRGLGFRGTQTQRLEHSIMISFSTFDSSCLLGKARADAEVAASWCLGLRVPGLGALNLKPLSLGSLALLGGPLSWVP